MGGKYVVTNFLANEKLPVKTKGSSKIYLDEPLAPSCHLPSVVFPYAKKNSQWKSFSRKKKKPGKNSRAETEIVVDPMRRTMSRIRIRQSRSDFRM